MGFRSREHRHDKVELEVYRQDTNQFVGYIKRTPLYSGQFGNWGYAVYSILGKRVHIAGGSGAKLTANQIQRLIERGELYNYVQGGKHYMEKT